MICIIQSISDYPILKYDSRCNRTLYSYYKIYVSIDLVIGVRQVLTFNYVHDKLSNLNIYSNNKSFYLHNQPRKKLWTFLILTMSGFSSSCSFPLNLQLKIIRFSLNIPHPHWFFSWLWCLCGRSFPSFFKVSSWNICCNGVVVGLGKNKGILFFGQC